MGMGWGVGGWGGEGAPNAYILWKSIALAIFQGGGGWGPLLLSTSLNLLMRPDIL